MRFLSEKHSTLEDLIKIEEFKYWDAQRNGCSPATLLTIENNIKSLKAQVLVLQLLSVQYSLS